MANFIQRPRLFNPAGAYQQGQLNKQRYDAGQLTNQMNQFALQEKQATAPMRREMERMKMMEQAQKLGANEQKELMDRMHRGKLALESYANMPMEEQRSQWGRFAEAMARLGADVSDWGPEYNPQKIQDEMLDAEWFLGNYQQGGGQYGMSQVWGVDENGEPVLMQMSSEGGVRRAELPPGVERFSDPMQMRDMGGYVQGYYPRTGRLGPAPSKTVPPQSTPEHMRDVAQLTEIGKGSAENAVKAFNRLPIIRSNISRLDAAIDAIDKGAKTGVLQRMLPTLTTASVELQQLRNELGLDVVGAVTFGALSKGELDIALDTALPDKLEPKPLRNWLVEKRTSQLKLWKYLSEQAAYLSRPGRTLADWYEYKGVESTPPESAPGQETPESVGRDVLSPDDKAELERLRKAQSK